MRFLFVYETAAGRARDLLAELLVSDVYVIVARRGELEPRAEDVQVLIENQGAEAAACELNRKYRKCVLPYVRFTVEPKKFRIEDQQLRRWLVGEAEPDVERARQLPRGYFAKIAADAPTLVIHPSALSSADDLDETRWPFAARSADLLKRHASGDPTLGPLRQWEAKHGVAFAANGQVTYRYHVEVGSVIWEHQSQWHLKAGDRTTPERAARVYFSIAQIAGLKVVLVAYVGPHPSDGIYSADFGSVAL